MGEKDITEKILEDHNAVKKNKEIIAKFEICISKGKNMKESLKEPVGVKLLDMRLHLTSRILYSLYGQGC